MDSQGENLQAAPRESSILLHAASRGVAFFLGGFTLLNLLGDLTAPGFDMNLWWIDLTDLPREVANALLLVAGVLLLGYGLYPRMAARRRWLTGLATGALLLFTAKNTITYLLLRGTGAIDTPVLMPVSGYLTLALLLVMGGVLCWRNVPARPVFQGAVLFLCLLGFPLAQIYGFGLTDYARPADAIVVFGARAYADGSPSTALDDRVRTACALYHQGLAPVLIMSGGPGDGPIHETEAMRRLAVTRYGVPESAIFLDPHGLDTAATVRGTTPLFIRIKARRVLAVSHFFHLPRIKMAYGRAGWNVYTVPVRHGALRSSVPYLVVREVAALGAYYFRPLWGG